MKTLNSDLNHSALQLILISLATCLALFNTVEAWADDSSLPFYKSAEFTPYWHTSDSSELIDFHSIPDFSFTNQEGKTISQENVAGKIYVASFFFSTCPGICPALRSKLSVVQDTFLNDNSVAILSHSIRPSIDSVDVLKAYAAKNDVKTGKWHLLTGEQNKLYTLAREAYFANEDLGDPSAKSDFLHTENLLLIDQNRHIRGVYNGLNQSSVKHLISDIRILKTEIEHISK